MGNEYHVYILASQKNGTLYIGVTSNLAQRVHQHKEKEKESFTKEYDVTNLVYYEVFDQIEDALHREKRLKKYNRQWKIDLINQFNPEWNDLSQNML